VTKVGAEVGFVCGLGVAFCLPGWCAEPMDVGFERAGSLPRAFAQYLLSADGLDAYSLEAEINPFYLQGDLNGDGFTDTAIFVREKQSGKRGLLIVHGATNDAYVLAAGSEFRGRGDDFSRFDAWYVYPRGPVSRSAHAAGEPPALQGDALHVEVLESASGIIYWAGAGYAWYQQGD
jgi:hypothetical protein